MATALRNFTDGRLPGFRLNEPAPKFEAPSSRGFVRLRDYGGSWLLLFALSSEGPWPDIRPLVEFAALAPEFRKDGTALVGAILGSSHPAELWNRAARHELGCELPFPLAVDPGPAWRRAAVRCAYVVDAAGVVRADVQLPREDVDVRELLLLTRALRGAGATTRLPGLGARRRGSQAAS
jgi:peroxiredoxin (alkyl hydroperoxide reductase subunit C)